MNPTVRRLRAVPIVSFCLLLLSGASMRAQDTATAPAPYSTPEPALEEFAPVVVIGSKENIRQQVGAAAYVDAQEIRARITPT